MSYNYKKICASLLNGLPQRTANVIERRFGLKTPNQSKLGTGQAGEKETLEAIGKSYGITRERVRQIEEEGFSKIRPKIKNYQNVFQYFNKELESTGNVREEESLLSFLGGRKNQNQVYFLLTLAEGFERYPEDDDFYSFWTSDKKALGSVKKVIESAINGLKKEKKPLSLEQLFSIQKAALSNKYINKNIFVSCLEVSKEIDKNGEGEIGLNNWVEINPRGIKDKAYLVLKKQGQPLHFSQVASLIENSPYFDKKKAHRATVHNELIKDPRFVLVGRGLYALNEWGYEPGVVKDIILKVLKESDKPLAKETIIEKVSKQRFVKPNTILLNLQDKSFFLKDDKGRYTIKES